MRYFVRHSTKYLTSFTSLANNSHYRFQFPRFPSSKTLIARPEAAADKDEYEMGQVKLKKVRNVLLDNEKMDNIREQHPLIEDATEEEYVLKREERIRAMLEEAEVDYDEYHKYLEMNKKGVMVVLQRDIDEVFINPFNTVWLEEWNGNIDIQPVGDFFGVITYVTEYAFKPEPSEIAIRKALEECRDKDLETKMKVIAQSFQDNREMGEAEATYKILPGLQMTMSNVGKQWVCLTRNEERTTRARRAEKEDVDAGKDIFELDHVEGQWMEQWDMRSKYERRHQSCWNITFAQFARMMVAGSKSKKEEDKVEDTADKEDENEVLDRPDEDDVEDEQEEEWHAPFHKVMECSHKCCNDVPKQGCEGMCCKPSKEDKKPRLKMTRHKRVKREQRLKELPTTIELSQPHAGEPKLMRKRTTIPAVLRFHKFNKETSPIKFFLQELILYVPFGLSQNGDMQNLLKESDNNIVALYEKYQEHIKEVKHQVLPFLEDVTEERFYVEKIRKEIQIEEIGLQMAPGKEEDNMQAMDEELRENPEFLAIDPDLLESTEEERVRISEYGRIIIPNKKELSEKTRALDKDQRKVVDIAVKYGRNIKKARKKGKRYPEPPHIIGHGAAGTGNF